jgi:hypothetical protein
MRNIYGVEILAVGNWLPVSPKEQKARLMNVKCVVPLGLILNRPVFHGALRRDYGGQGAQGERNSNDCNNCEPFG